jgi:hypothetical protein
MIWLPAHEAPWMNKPVLIKFDAGEFMKKIHKPFKLFRSDTFLDHFNQSIK